MLSKQLSVADSGDSCDEWGVDFGYSMRVEKQVQDFELPLHDEDDIVANNSYY